ncbi:MAG: glycosyltransferase [Lachnospiraceae bacterium]|nr:glycosyltransferase [Lachnospiraceae bacterium]
MKAEPSVKISVIIPAYNVEKYIGQCLESIIMQTVRDLEILCTEDVSQDNTAKILADYAARDDRIKVLYHEKNMGYQASRNECMQMAQGRYIYFLDGDDYLKRPDAFALILDRMEKDGLDMLCFETQTIDELVEYKREKPFDGHKRADYPEVMTGAEGYIRLFENGEYRSPVWLYMYSAEFLKRTGIRFIEDSCSEDISFTFHVHLKADRMGILNEELHCYRLRDNSQVHSGRRKYKTISAHKNVVYLLDVVKSSDLCDGQIDSMIAKESAMEIERWRERFEQCDYPEKLSYYRSITSYSLKEMFVRLLLDGIPYVLPDDICEFLEKKKVYLYGAGVYAKRYIRLLNRYGLRLENILVTKADSEKLCGYRVLEYEGLSIPEDALIIPAVSERYKNEIMRILEDRDHEIIDLELYRLDD